MIYDCVILRKATPLKK